MTNVTLLGVEPTIEKPYNPTTQGKNERFHQALFRCFAKQLFADSLDQQEQVGQIYNIERPHQGLPGRITPQQAWVETPTVAPPDDGRMTRIGGIKTVFRRRARFRVSRTLAGTLVYIVETETSRCSSSATAGLQSALNTSAAAVPRTLETTQNSSSDRYVLM